MRRSYKGIFSENITDRPIFGRINQNSAAKVHKPTIQKPKIIKNWFFQKSDAEGVSRSILVQELPTTPKALIFDSKNSSHEELIQHQFFEKSHFLTFFDFHMSRKVILRRTQRKNYHLKDLSTNSSDFLDVFCTINEYTTTSRSKNTFCQSTLILPDFPMMGFVWQFSSKMSVLWQNIFFDLDVVVYSYMVQNASKTLQEFVRRTFRW